MNQIAATLIVGIVKLVGYSIFATGIIQAYTRKRPVEPLAFDERGCIGVSRYCAECGYNTRGLPRTGKCPECGSPYSADTEGNLHELPRKRRENPLLIGLVRTAIGLLVGLAFWTYLAPLVDRSPRGPTPIAWLWLAPFRIGEWAVTVSIFFRGYRDRWTDLIVILLGTVWSYMLDFPSMVGLFFACGGVPC